MNDELDRTELAAKCANAKNSIIECIEHIELSVDDDNNPKYYWWELYWEARVHLRQLALIVIESRFRDAHPDRRSMNYKEIAQDITEIMKDLIEPTRDYQTCPKCKLWVPPLDPCIGCLVKESGIIQP